VWRKVETNSMANYQLCPSGGESVRIEKEEEDCPLGFVTGLLKKRDTGEETWSGHDPVQDG